MGGGGGENRNIAAINKRSSRVRKKSKKKNRTVGVMWRQDYTKIDGVYILFLGQRLAHIVKIDTAKKKKYFKTLRGRMDDWFAEGSETWANHHHSSPPPPFRKAFRSGWSVFRINRSIFWCQPLFRNNPSSIKLSSAPRGHALNHYHLCVPQAFFSLCAWPSNRSNHFFVCFSV